MKNSAKTQPDFSGYVTRYNVKCSDGRTIYPGAFAENDGKIVPLIWNHARSSIDNVLGQVLLEHRDDGVYGECYLNETVQGQNARELVRHGDITDFSILANRLKPVGTSIVEHGDIKEVSIVLAGANPQAYIDNILMHSDLDDDETIIYNNEADIIEHSEEIVDEDVDKDEEVVDEDVDEDEEIVDEDEEEIIDDGEDQNGDNIEHSDDDETVEDVVNTMSEKQQKVMYYLIGKALENKIEGENEGDDDTMKHNVFDDQAIGNDENVLEQSDIREIFDDAKSVYGSLKKSVLQHGITEIENLLDEDFHDTNSVQTISRDQQWVAEVLNKSQVSPFGRLRTRIIDITADEARAKGYIKGNKKVEEQIATLKRTCDPQTIYKKQALDRDDVIDMEPSFDVVSYLKGELKYMLNEEKARAMLFGDGRAPGHADKINPLHIIPVWQDDPVYTINSVVEVAKEDTPDTTATKIIRAAVKAKKDYRGSGAPVCFMEQDLLTDISLMTDSTGRDIYEDETKIAKKLGVSKIIPVPVMDSLTREGSEDHKTYKLRMVIVNMNDYKQGLPKLGKESLFSDFDIDFNKEKYLLETRMSGMLFVPKSAITIETTAAAPEEAHAG